MLAIDLEEPLPLSSATYDYVIAFNLFEHIFNHQQLFLESARIIKESGTFLMFVPFSYIYHADPHDYFRYTHETLKRILSELFEDVEVTGICCGTFSVAAGIAERALRFRFARFLCVLTSLSLDRLRRTGTTQPDAFYSGLFVEARRPRRAKEAGRPTLAVRSGESREGSRG